MIQNKNQRLLENLLKQVEIILASVVKLIWVIPLYIPILKKSMMVNCQIISKKVLLIKPWVIIMSTLMRLNFKNLYYGIKGLLNLSKNSNNINQKNIF